ncbi:MAG: hypothetical protein QOI20_157 [Acidimicrobiaceae bacterium]|jgi:D-alanyl-D-alanine carboxypeptidase/D-alanyl-D-alanine-endopeptidase (penicillin-binding protein 4)|nr:hypothetical protein [Acidimicrobiaceae bacterium]
MPDLRRAAAPVVLAVLTAASAAVAVHAPPAPHSRLAGLAQPAAPVLSVRRVPELLSRTIADVNLSTRLDAALADPALGDGRRSSCLIVRHNERTLYSKDPDQALIPASNLKLLTALAVLAKLGPDEHLVTTVKGRPPGADGTVVGPLYVVGGGDPLLETADYAASFKNQPQIRTAFEQLADDLVAHGVRHVTGPVLGDEGRFDTQRYVPTWRPRYIADAEVGPAAALLVNDGFTQFKPKHIAATSPAAHAAAVLTDLLKGRGVVIDGAPAQGSAPDGPPTLTELRSPPIRDVIAEMLKESDNTTAELLTKELGRRVSGPGKGTTAAGVDAVRQILADAGVPAAALQALRAVDGSGLDRSDRATCTLLLHVLTTGPTVGPLQRGLPTAAREGTLAERFQNNPAAGRLRAKTGSLDGVVGLSGLVDAPTPAGSPLAFSLLVNDLPKDAAGRALQESVGAILARYPDAPAPDQLAPQ